MTTKEGGVTALALAATTTTTTTHPDQGRFCPHSQWLPYGAELPAEAARSFEDLRAGLTDVLVKGKINGIKFWCRYLDGHLNMYKYHFSVPDHVHLVELLWAVFQLDDLDRTVRSMLAASLTRLLKKKYLLRPVDLRAHGLALVLDWRPFHALIVAHFFRKLRDPDPISQGYATDLAACIRQARRFFPPDATREIFTTLAPLLCVYDESVHQAAVLLSLLLPTRPDSPAAAAPDFLAWLPDLFSVYRWFAKAADWQAVWAHLFARTAYDNIGRIDWTPHYSWLFTEFLDMLAVPVGGAAVREAGNVLSGNAHKLIQDMNLQSSMALWIVSMLDRSAAVLVPLKALVTSVSSFFHPSNLGKWSGRLSLFVHELCAKLALRRREEEEGLVCVAEADRLTPDLCNAMAEMLLEPLLFSLFSKSPVVVMHAASAFRALAYLAPTVTLPRLLDSISPALENITEANRTMSALLVAVATVRPLLTRGVYRDGVAHAVPLLNLCLPGIDGNDHAKTQLALQVFSELFTSFPLVDASGSQWSRAGLNEAEAKAADDSALLEDIVSQVLDRVLELMEVQVAASTAHYSVEESIGVQVRVLCQHLFQQMSEPFVEAACNKLFLWITTHTVTVSAKPLGHVCGSACRVSSAAADKFVPWLSKRILDVAASHSTVLSAEANEDVADELLIWWMHLLPRIVRRGGANIFKHRALIVDVLDAVLPLASRKAAKLGGKLLRQFLRTLVDIYPLRTRFLPQGEGWDPVAQMAQRGGVAGPYTDPGITFHVPTQEEWDFAETLLARFYAPALTELLAIANGTHATWSGLPDLQRRLLVRSRLTIVRNVARVSGLMPETNLPTVVEDEFENDRFQTSFGRLPVVVSMAHTMTETLVGLRSQLCQAVNTLTTFLLAQRGDDTKALSIVVKIACHLLSHRGMRESTWQELKQSHRMQKQAASSPLRHRKIIPKALLTDAAQLQHLFRQVWNSHTIVLHAEHAALLDSLFALCISTYSKVRTSAQGGLAIVLRKLPQARRTIFIKAVSLLGQEGIARHTLKGLLFVLQNSSLARSGAQKWKLFESFCQVLAPLHRNDDPRIQTLVNAMFAAFKRAIGTPSLTVVLSPSLYDVVLRFCPTDTRRDFYVNEALPALQERTGKIVEGHRRLMLWLVDHAASLRAHWRYEMMIAGLLEVILRFAPQQEVAVLQYWLQLLAHENLFMRSLGATAASMLLVRSKTSAPRRAIDKPVRTTVALGTLGMRPDTAELAFRMNPAQRAQTGADMDKQAYVDKNFTGWGGWPLKPQAYVPFAERPPRTPSAFDSALLAAFSDAAHTTTVASYFAQEAHDGSAGFFTGGVADLFKGLARTGPAMLALLRPKIEELCASADKPAHQRGAAEMLAGFVRGSKHWSGQETQDLWAWLVPLLRRTWAAVGNECLAQWRGAVHYFVYDRDARRLYPLMDLLLEDTLCDDTQTPFAQARLLNFLTSAFMQLSWRGAEIARMLLVRLAPHLGHAYKLVRERVCMLALDCVRMGLWPVDNTRAEPVAAEEGLACVQNFISTFLASLVPLAAAEPEEAKKLLARRLKTFLLFSEHAFNLGVPSASFWLLPRLLPTLFSAPEMSDDPEIQPACTRALHAASNLALPAPAFTATLAVVLEAAGSPSWHVRRRALVFMQTSMFRNYFLVPRESVLAAVLARMEDEHVEVRALAGATLSGLVRCGLADADALRPALLARADTPIRQRKRGSTAAAAAPPTAEDKQNLVRRHGGVLGLAALLEAFPYAVPAWMPAALVALSTHISDPDPIGPTVKVSMSEFWRTHRDNWADMRQLFTEDQLLVLTDLLISPSYYA